MLGFAPDQAGTAPTAAAAQQDPAEGEQNARSSEDDRVNKTANKMKFRPLTSDEIQNGDDKPSSAVRLAARIEAPAALLIGVTLI
jgi:hypothetical protein